MKPILNVLYGQEPSRRALWIMRQAGRYLPEYRQLRAKAGSFLNLCYNPELACEVTLQPLKRFDFDAAILFSDILVVPHAMGLHLEFREGEGPHLETVHDAASVSGLGNGFGSAQFKAVFETVSRVKQGLSPTQTLIGFCGAPWTVASYMIEGRSSQRSKALAAALENPMWFSDLFARLIEASAHYLIEQIKAGAEVVQIFDSWAGDLPHEHRQRLVIDPIAAIIKIVRQSYPDFPVIVFARGVGEDHALIALGTGANAIGLEEDVVASEVLATLPSHVSVQGNLLNRSLLGDAGEMIVRAKSILETVPRSRHIFNLGHGILPETDITMVEKLVATVRDFG